MRELNEEPAPCGGADLEESQPAVKAKLHMITAREDNCRGLMLMVVNSEKLMDDDKVTITGTWHAIINTTGTNVLFCHPEKEQS
jgi:hypothetical protein